MDAPSRQPTPFRSTLAIAVSTCVALALLDMLGGLLRAPNTFAPLSAAMISYGVSLLAFTLLYFGVALTLGPYFVFAFRLNPMCCATSLSTFWITLLTCSSATLGAHTPRDAAQRRTLLLCALAALIVGVVAYPLARKLLAPTGAAKAWGRRALIALLMLATAVGALWLHHNSGGGGGVLVALIVLCMACLLGIIASTGDAPAKRLRRAGLLVAWPLVIVACVGVGGTAKRQFAALAAGDLRVPHVVVIVVDTLRADALSCYGQTAISTPHIDAFATKGVRFANAMSAAPWTVPGTASLMTGLSPLAHGAHSGGVAVPDNARTLAEYLEDAGYRTGAIGFNPHLSPLVANLNQGIDDYRMFPRVPTDTIGDKLVAVLINRFMGKPPEVTTTQLTDLAIDWVTEHAEEPFFLWLHYFDPHLPYAPPAKYLEGTTSTPTIRNAFVDMPNVREGHLVPTAADRARIHELYLGEVRYVDDQVQRLLDKLQELGIYDEAIVILTSDHGEEFWDHKGFEHGHSVYREVLNVPLIVKTPGQTTTGFIDQPVSTESVVPTVLDLCGIDYETESLTGRSLVPLLQQSTDAAGGDAAARPVLSTGLIYYEDRIGLVYDGYKYIRWLICGDEELYDLRTDPYEQHNLLPLEDETPLLQARALVAQAEQDANRLKEHWDLGEPTKVEMDDATLERLRNLGYVGN
ncbi:MAG: sulfatase [Phycisphaerales bacterium]|nr:sulfatase [Phycisphaerales bacterium]